MAALAQVVEHPQHARGDAVGAREEGLGDHEDSHAPTVAARRWTRGDLGGCVGWPRGDVWSASQAVHDDRRRDASPADQPSTGFVAVVPAGGAGTRLWPLSPRRRPKFLHDLTGTGRTLLQATVDRLRPLVGDDGLLLVTGRAHLEAVRAQLPGPRRRRRRSASRRRATRWPPSGWPPPCWCVATPRSSSARSPPTTSSPTRRVPGHRPAGRRGRPRGLGLHHRHRADPRRHRLRLRPLRRRRSTSTARRDAQVVAEFVEKPDPDTATRYLEQGGYRWNAGMFVVRAATLLEHLRPAAAGAARRAGRDRGGPGGGRRRGLDRVWPGLTKIAIDHAVAEPVAAAGGVAAVPGGVRLGRRRRLGVADLVAPAAAVSRPRVLGRRVWPSRSARPGRRPRPAAPWPSSASTTSSSSTPPTPCSSPPPVTPSGSRRSSSGCAPTAATTCSDGARSASVASQREAGPGPLPRLARVTGTEPAAAPPPSPRCCGWPATPRPSASSGSGAVDAVVRTAGRLGPTTRPPGPGSRRSPAPRRTASRCPALHRRRRRRPGARGARRPAVRPRRRAPRARPDGWDVRQRHAGTGPGRRPRGGARRPRRAASPRSGSPSARAASAVADLAGGAGRRPARPRAGRARRRRRRRRRGRRGVPRPRRRPRDRRRRPARHPRRWTRSGCAPAPATAAESTRWSPLAAPGRRVVPAGHARSGRRLAGARGRRLGRPGARLRRWPPASPTCGR